MKALRLFLTGFVLAGFAGSGKSFAAGTTDATQTVSGGGVTVAVTYVNPRNNEIPRFQVALNTHSVALDSYDFKNLALLRDGTGKTSRRSGGSGIRSSGFSFRHCWQLSLFPSARLR